jgi:hypothetical protein
MLNSWKKIAHHMEKAAPTAQGGAPVEKRQILLSIDSLIRVPGGE